jgi:hypothetical protein
MRLEEESVLRQGYDHISWEYENIQGVPGGKYIILGGHSIGHSEQKTVYMYTDMFRDRAISLYSSKIVDKEILRAVFNTGIYYSIDRVGTVYPV